MRHFNIERGIKYCDTDDHRTGAVRCAIARELECNGQIGWVTTIQYRLISVGQRNLLSAAVILFSITPGRKLAAAARFGGYPHGLLRYSVAFLSNG